jgi:hypothetical protein
MMVFRPRKDMHFSRRALGLLFLACGLLLLTVHYLAGLPFLLLAGIFLYYAPRWDLRIEVGEGRLRFSENVLDTAPVELFLADLAEIRRVSEESGRRNLLTGHVDFMDFVEFETRSGKVWRMHDVFPEALDEELARLCAAAGVQVKDLGN